MYIERNRTIAKYIIRKFQSNYNEEKILQASRETERDGKKENVKWNSGGKKMIEVFL